MDDPERSYRRGYTHGAWVVIEYVRGKISSKDQERLESWLNNDAREWRLRAYTGESKRGPAGHTLGLEPPRHRLNPDRYR